MSFRSAQFMDVVRDVSAGNEKLPQSAFNRAGRLAVVDQGQEFIAGYTDDLGYQFKSAALPIIVFGDHTKAVKFIDFPFAMGADGVKVLKPTTECDPKYLYHFLRQVKIPNAGYSRHFKFLKELRIPLPPLAEQCRIAAILDKADALRTLRREAITKLDQLLQSLFLDMFGDPIANEHKKPSVPLADVVAVGRPITYGILKPGNDIPDGVPYIRVVDIKNGGVNYWSVKKTTPEIARAYKRSEVQAGDLLMSIRGHVGRLGVVPPELHGANITQDTARIAVGSEFEANYVLGLLNSVSIQQHMRRFTRGAAVQGINLKDVREIPVLMPTRDAQAKYALAVDSIRSMRRAKVSHLTLADKIFFALQQRCFEMA